MVERYSSMMEPPIEQLLDHVDSKFTLVTLAAKRGRQINSYFNQLGEGLGAIVPPQVPSTARKPLSIAMEEIAADKVTFERTEVEEGASEAAEEAVLGGATEEGVGAPEAPEDADAPGAGDAQGALGGADVVNDDDAGLDGDSGPDSAGA